MTADDLLQRELWTSWASCLRSYAAVHGLGGTHHAVVEVSAHEILLRVDNRWARFSPTEYTPSAGAASPFRLNADGTVTVAEETDEMDLAAERLTRALFLA